MFKNLFLSHIRIFVEYEKQINLPCMINQQADCKYFRKHFVYLHIRYTHVFPVIILEQD